MSPRKLGPPPEATSEAVSRSMRGNRPTDTGPEIEMRRLLRGAGCPGYRLQWRAAGTRPDVSYPRRKVAVFVHGCYWHRCPHCEPSLPKTNRAFWRRKFELNMQRDARNVAALEAEGWTVVTVWECRLWADAGGELGQVLRALGSTDRRASSTLSRG